MKKQQDSRCIAARHDRPFSLDTADVHSLTLHIIGHGPNRTNIVEAFSPLRPPDGSRLGTQQRADSIDFALSHCAILSSQTRFATSPTKFCAFMQRCPNVYLCSSGSHPGPGISMAPGRNAAQVNLP